MKKILVIGACGQIGSDLIPALRRKYGNANVIATDRRNSDTKEELNTGPFIILDATDINSIKHIIHDFEIDTIYHLASLLSAKGEKMHQTAWTVNMDSLINVLEVAREFNIEKIIWPSSIAAFGPTTPRNNTPNDTVLRPTTMYGITKVAGELLVEYYNLRWNIDTRSVRLPGIISSKTHPGGGTTDFAVEIFYEALKNKTYTCFVNKNTILPMLYMPDCIKALVNLMDAKTTDLKHRIFNVTGMSFSAEQLANEIKKHIPEFQIKYEPDYRQSIADSWPKTIDDSCAKEEWGWKPDYNLASMTKDMIEKLSERVQFDK
ncbi:MAG: NAD-dependent epimerase/dehydratase family protein [archaeon]|nr:NAD-dependent epimerase/dehydratase family protein [archaeon]